MSQFPKQTQPLLFFLFWFWVFSPPFSQSLSYRQGQVLVRLLPKVNAHSFLKKLSARSSDMPVFDRIETVDNEWNIYLLHFDFARFSETKTSHALLKLPEVLHAQKNHIILPRLKPNDPFFFRQWHHVNDGTIGNPQADFDSDLAWDITTGGLTEDGDTIVVCVIDDGLERKHADIMDNLWINHQEIPNNGLDDDKNGYVDDYWGWSTLNNSDQYGAAAHGTAVCGLAAAKGNNNLGICGINWNVKLMFIAGGGSEANAIQAYLYALRQRQRYNNTKGKSGAYVVCVNSSWGNDFGKPEDAPLWCAMYDSLGQAGILAAAATSNQNINVDIEGDLPTTCGSDYLITVTNVNIDNIKDNDAAYGPISIDIGAYGEDVYSIYLNNSYRNFKGTSAAAPQVAGAIALLYSVPCNNLARLSKINPAAAALEAKQILFEYAKPNASLSNITTTGAVMNIGNAVNSITPLELTKSDKNQLTFEFDAHLLLPVQIQWRMPGSLSVHDTTLYSNKPFSIGPLESCQTYEIRYKGLCARFTDAFSPWRSYKTSGCCSPPEKIRLTQTNEHSVSFIFHNSPSAQKLGAHFRLRNSTAWDTIFFNNNDSPLELNNLVSCASYEIQFWTYCDNQVSSSSGLITFQTKGCSHCTELDYCRRHRPQSNLEWIEAITINGVTFISGNDGGFGNYVGQNQQWLLQKGKTQSISIKPGFKGDSSKLLASCWIDYNQDGFFSETENAIISKDKFSREKSFAFSLPAQCKTGFTRMRVVLKFSEFSEEQPLACFQSLEFGEYEDYCVYIAANPCNESWSVQPVLIEKTAAAFELLKPVGLAIAYAFRKLKSPTWITGSTTQNSIIFNNLDSCTAYEFQFREACRPQVLTNIKTETIAVRTPGANCSSTNVKAPFYLEAKIYPTACFDRIYCQFSTTPTKSIDYIIFNNQFRAVHSGTLLDEINTIDVLNLAQGMYFIYLTDEHRQTVCKFLKF